MAHTKQSPDNESEQDGELELKSVLVREIPIHVHAAFKARCAGRNKSMNDRMIELMILDARGEVR